ncbi:hypothetical protein RI129_004180 [Pyrocoelia pectoralis]|uniref:Glycosyl transferase CAP10 domain-containing protein n=1 Tax=Pyrocoelia pectoralis TaxID=417401 RepID=A0AAN7VHN8_9COLE
MHTPVILSFIPIFIISVCGEASFRVWGPGLKPQAIVMPARYFFLQSYNESCNLKDLEVEVDGTSPENQRCRIWKNILYTHNCLYIVRYKLYNTCANLKISIKYGEVEQTYDIKSYIYPEDCNCPRVPTDKWLNDWECGSIPNQIVKDLDTFKAINFDNLREKIIEKFNQPGSISLCHYVVKNNEVYRQCYGKYVGFKMFMDSILLSLARKVLLPDVEFFVNLGDWPLVKDAKDNFPIFSWSGSADTFDIVMPTYDLTESTLENMGRVMLDMLSVQGNVDYPWEERIPKVFWRGRDSNRQRLHLIELSKKHPHLFNASLTNFFFFRDEEEKYGPKAEHVSFFKFFEYKYQVCIDGTVAAYRLPYLLAGGSLLIKQESKYYEHFYNDLIPDTHFIVIKRDLSNLIEKVNWAIENDDKAKKMANAGRAFAMENLLPKNIFCYHTFLLNEFSKRITNKIKVLNDMELVENTSKDCNCDKTNRDEL